MKTVIFEQPVDTILFADLKLTDFIGVQLQNTKAILIKDGLIMKAVLASLVTVPAYDFDSANAEEGLKQFTDVYKFDSLAELIGWL